MPQRATKKLSRTVNSRPRDSRWKAGALRDLCSAQGVEAEHLAVATGVKAPTAERWLRGQTVPDIVQAKDIATRLGVMVDDLLLPGAAVTASDTSSSGRAAKR